MVDDQNNQENALENPSNGSALQRSEPGSLHDSLLLSDYDYELPKRLIAQNPLENRAQARMLVANRATGDISHRHVGDFIEALSPQDTLILNNTKVVPARLLGHRTATGGHWEGLFLEILPDGRWHIMGSTRGKIVQGETVTLARRLDGTVDPTSAALTVVGTVCDDIQIRFEEKQPDGTWFVAPLSEENYLSILDRTGRVPIPPYIRGGAMEESDVNNYQTVFAQIPGAVAAPTAGLHFSLEMLDQIRAKGVEIDYVTLHVGIGTFRPISVEKLSDHVMHHEYAEVSQETATRINERRAAGGRTVAIGTTCVRTLESAALSGTLQPFHDQTNLFIKPPYDFHAVDVMLTNFHLPKSTLLVMIRAFGGWDLMVEAYRQAVEREYRFFSYGDCMVIL